jgi:hypothetical protein
MPGCATPRSRPAVTESGGVEVIISDHGAGFDPAQVGPLSRGLRNSVLERLRVAGGETRRSSLSLARAPRSSCRGGPRGHLAPRAVDSLAWARRVAPRPQLIFLGFMLPVLLAGLLLLCLRWQDMRWPAAAAAVSAGLVGVAVVCTRCLSQVRMTRRVGGQLDRGGHRAGGGGIAGRGPGDDRSFAFWVSGNTGIVIAAVYFIRGPVPGLTALALDLAALTVGVLTCGGATSHRRAGFDPGLPRDRRWTGHRLPGRLPRPVQLHRIPAGRAIASG